MEQEKIIMAVLRPRTYNRLSQIELETDNKDLELEKKISKIITEVYKGEKLSAKERRDMVKHLKEFWIYTLKRSI